MEEDTCEAVSFDVGKMLIVTEKKNKIDEWINISVNGRNYRVKVWEEECEKPFSSFLIYKNEGSRTGDLEVSRSPQSSGKDVDGVMESTKVRDLLGEDKADNPSVDEVMESTKARDSLGENKVIINQLTT